MMVATPRFTWPARLALLLFLGTYSLGFPGGKENSTCPWVEPGDNVPASCSATAAPEVSSNPVSNQWIVRFTNYLMADDHHSQLSQQLDSEGSSWRWIERNNAATQHPTDFGVLDISETDINQVQERLKSLPFVKDMHLDRRIGRALKGGNQQSTEPSVTDFTITKRPGRFSTRLAKDLEDNMQDDKLAELLPVSHLANTTIRKAGRGLLNSRGSVTSMLQADQLWAMGYSGKGVKVGVFDTGIRQDHPHLRNIRDRTNWTHQDSLSDGLGHGSFVAGVIGSQSESCPGFAPDVELHTFKVFTDDQVSYTSWFMDAFNYAIISKVNVINLSIGGPDYLDMPFVEKVWEVTSSGIMMISAIGNDGPLYGTLNNPADQNDVIGVGGIDNWGSIAGFSSRGMSTWELPTGYGRVKPDVMAYAKDVQGSSIQGGCRALSGTSVASPVVAGAVCLLASTVPEEKRWSLLNPASMKQALVEGATRLPNLNIYEQGHGRINLPESQKILASYTPRASVLPNKLDLTSCPYMWPHCTQPLYAGAMPLMFNATILNGMGVTGKLEGPPEWLPLDQGGKLLQLEFDWSVQLWPWSGYLAIFIHVDPAAGTFQGTGSGTIRFTVVSPGVLGETEPRRSTVELPLKASIIPTPDRTKRVLWDQFHSVKYPPAYLPRDNLDIKNDILDWHGDHLHTNFHDFFNYMREKGYFVEVMASPATCFDAMQYGALLIADSEEEFYEEEIQKLAADIKNQGLFLIIFGEWYNTDTMMAMRFFDDNSRSWWTPITGGANVPALNDLLAPYGAAFGDAVLNGFFNIGSKQLRSSAGANIARFPTGGILYTGAATNSARGGAAGNQQGDFGLFGLTQVGQGHLAVFGDSNCLDSSHQSSSCYDFMVGLLDQVLGGQDNGIVDGSRRLSEPYSSGKDLPPRSTATNFSQFSFVKTHPLKCYQNAPCSYQTSPNCVNTPKPPPPAPAATPSPVIEDPVQNPQSRKESAAGTTTIPSDNRTSDPKVVVVETNESGRPDHPLDDSTGTSMITATMNVSRWIALVGVVAVIVLWRFTGKRASPGGVGRSNSRGQAGFV